MRDGLGATSHSKKAALAHGLLAACLLTPACDGDGGSPTSPSPPTASSLTVAYLEEHGTIYIGDEVQFQAMVSSDGGEGQPATNIVWASDAPAVATVSPSGLVTAASAGEATISAETPSGSRGSRRIRVFPEFHGRWEGDLNVTSMTVPSDWEDLGEESCDGLADCASWIPLRADFTQEGATVTGVLTSTFATSPNYEWTVQSGRVSIDGRLSLTSDEIAFRVPDGALEIRARLTSWESRADAPGIMTGAATVRYSSEAQSGNPMLEGCLAADNATGECAGWRRQRGGAGTAGLSGRRGVMLRYGAAGNGDQQRWR